MILVATPQSTSLECNVIEYGKLSDYGASHSKSNICIYTPVRDNKWRATYTGLKFPFVGERDGANGWAKAQYQSMVGGGGEVKPNGWKWCRAFGLNGGIVSGYCGCS